MTKQDEAILKKIKETNKDAEKLDIRVVRKICHDPANFTANRFRDPDDKRPIMWRYVGKFVLMNGAEKRKD